MQHGQLHTAADLWCRDFHLDTARQVDQILQTTDAKAGPTATSSTCDLNADA